MYQILYWHFAALIYYTDTECKCGVTKSFHHHVQFPHVEVKTKTVHCIVTCSTGGGEGDDGVGSVSGGHLVQEEAQGQEVTVYPWLAGVLTTDTTGGTSRGSVGVCAGGT